jgi:CheY-like chemotaxis protein
MNLKETILIVDDTLTNIDILVNLLDKYDIVVATSGEEALSILSDGEEVDLILLDIMMPKMDGFEVCKILKSDYKYKEIPIIFLTAKFDDGSIQKGFEIGAVDYIIKPFRPIELLARIKTHLKIITHEKNTIEYNKSIAIAELIQNIAHQWRQPLSVISTASSAILLQKELNILDDTELVDYCNKITNNTEYLSKIIDNVSNILEDTIESSQINIDDIFERNSMLLFGNTLENKIKINLNIENNIVITGNRNKFIEILLAITSNSIELFEDMELDNKSIFVNVKKDRNNCKLYIYDNGNGMPALLINRVFEPYFTTKHKSQGKGLGLYLVKKSIEELFKGSISVSNIEFMNNQKREKGACFEISIPFR